VESTPALGKALPLRGVTSEQEPWLVHEDEGSIQPSVRRADDERGVLKKLDPRRGTSDHTVLRQQAVSGGVLRSRLLGPSSPALPSNLPPPQATVGSRGRPQATFRQGGGFWDVDFGVLASPRSASQKDWLGSQPSQRFLERGGALLPKKERRK